MLLVERGGLGLAGMNVVVSVALWLLAVWIGDRIAARLN